ncbi:MAG: hypothetical protein F4066_11515 [Chloroflexi bacterium]|nr:hypothetical protein [Chloroflexota bacterium]MYF82433.1 hypothetical protein [Chloroflexota bacterium]MYI05468.1 hypothetical protein [Chloroflexota bacterium]
MSTELVIGILILLLVVGVPVVQAMVRAFQRRRSLGIDGVSALRAAGLRTTDLPAGLSPQTAEAVTSEAIALADDNPEATIAQLDESGRVIGYRESYRDPRSMGEFLDWVCGQTVYRNRAHRRVELELTRYETADQALAALAEEPRLDPSDAEVSVEDAGERGGILAREWTRSENGAGVQRMLELRWASGDVLAVVRGDSEPSGALDDDDVRRAAELVKGRLE